jgi:uncharacterized OB-fold protein
MSLAKEDCCPTCWNQYGRAIPLKAICPICGSPSEIETIDLTETETIETIDI